MVIFLSVKPPPGAVRDIDEAFAAVAGFRADVRRRMVVEAWLHGFYSPNKKPRVSPGRTEAVYL